MSDSVDASDLYFSSIRTEDFDSDPEFDEIGSIEIERSCSNVSSSGSDRFAPPEPYDKTKDNLERMDEVIRSNLFQDVGPPTLELSSNEKVHHWFYLNLCYQRKKEMKDKQKREDQIAANLQAEAEKQKAEKQKAENDKSDQA